MKLALASDGLGPDSDCRRKRRKALPRPVLTLCLADLLSKILCGLPFTPWGGSSKDDETHQHNGHA